MTISVDGITGLCMVCGKPLFPLRERRDARTCSVRCRVRLWRKRHQIRRQPLHRGQRWKHI